MSEKLYELVFKELKEELKFLEVDSKFYSERSLAKYKNISKLTARKIINLLVEDGYLYKKSNLGTYVKKQAKMNLILFSLFDNELSYKMIYMNNIYNSIFQANNPFDKNMSRFVFKTFKNDKINSIEEIMLISEYTEFCDFFTQLNKEREDIEIFKDKKVKQTFKAEIVPTKFASLLEVEANTPIVVITNEFVKDNEVFMIIKSYINPLNNEFKIY